MGLPYQYIKKFPELCVPAGNLKILKYAIEYGADAVYAGGGRFNLRTLGDNFTPEDLHQAAEYVHARGRKLYFTLNAIISESEIRGLECYMDEIKAIEFDAVIVSDAGVFQLLKKTFPGMRLHISTQVSTSNHEAVNFWGKLGAARVNLARELSIDEVRDICRKSNIETEVFIHGALCISYSGRCMLSKYLSGRDANKGECSHTCRWKYYLMEEKRPNSFFPVDQDKKGTYIYNSRDLCLLEKLDMIVDCGADSLKVEGRMKTENYVGTVTWVYRKALDLIKDRKFTEQKKKSLLKELDKTTHRNFTTGFMFNNKPGSPELAENDNVGYIRKYRFAGSVSGFSKKYNGPIIKARNQVRTGDVLDILQPGKNPVKFKLEKMLGAKSEILLNVCNTNEEMIIWDLGMIDNFSLIKVRI